MDRRLFGYTTILVLLILSNTVLADHREVKYRRFQSDADAYTQHQFGRKHDTRWQSVADFRTRRHHSSEPVVAIDRRVSAIQLEGLKRTTYVRSAYAQTRRGRMIHVPELEGRLIAGYTKTVGLHTELYIRKLVLEVDSPRHKRAYVRVSVRSAPDRDHRYSRYRGRH